MYPKVSAQVATDFFSRIGGDFSFDILTRKYNPLLSLWGNKYMTLTLSPGHSNSFGD